jgi:hypothetical protein
MPYTLFSLPIKRSAITPGTLADRSFRGRPLNVQDIFGLPRWPWKRSWIASGSMANEFATAQETLEAILEKLDCFGTLLLNPDLFLSWRWE